MKLWLSCNGAQAMIKLMRYLLILPAASIGLVSLIFLTSYITYVAGYLFCPTDSFHSGTCYSSSFRNIERGCIILSVSISAILTVLLPSIVTPDEKDIIAKTIYILGSILAVIIGVSVEAWLEMIFALFFGGYTAFLVNKKYPYNRA